MGNFREFIVNVEHHTDGSVHQTLEDTSVIFCHRPYDLQIHVNPPRLPNKNTPMLTLQAVSMILAGLREDCVQGNDSNNII